MPAADSAQSWYVICTFNCKELLISEYLKTKGVEHFIPMTYVERILRDGQKKRLLVPVIHNLIFFQLDRSWSEMNTLLSECCVPLRVMRSRETNECYEIPLNQMIEFRSMCDPDFPGTRYVTAEEVEAKAGKEVQVVHGPFSGMTGKLQRVHNNYYFVKVLAGVGVMVRISRWYCKVIG